MGLQDSLHGNWVDSSFHLIDSVCISAKIVSCMYSRGDAMKE